MNNKKQTNKTIKQEEKTKTFGRTNSYPKVPTSLKSVTNLKPVIKKKKK